MKRQSSYLLICLMLLICSVLLGQEEAVTSSGKKVLLKSDSTWVYVEEKDTVQQTQSTILTPLDQVLKDASSGTAMWSLSVHYKDDEHPVITHKQFTEALDTFNEYSPPSEYHEALKYRTEMKGAFKLFGMYCDEIAIFLSNPGKRPIPFRFADKDGKKCVVLTDMASSTVYNTLRTTSKTRAAKVLTSCFIPNIRYLYRAFEKTDIAYFGLTIVYGSKDFSNKSDVRNLKPEMLAFIFPREKCKQFIEGSITESEFVDASGIYLTDRDMMFSFKKVKIQIE